MSNEALPIRAFLSYARSDDVAFNFVTPLKAKLETVVKAKSGRPLEIFLDQADIEWGAKWRERLTDEVTNATIFLPVLSANYLESEHCRSEFLAFHSKAKVLGVTELLLPILLFESAIFAPGSPDEVVQIAEARQWKCIEAAVIAGGDSPVWLAIMVELAEALLTALGKAEESISSEVLGADVGDDSPPSLDPGHEPPEDDERLGLAELMLLLQTGIEGMTAAASEVGAAIEALGDCVESVGGLNDNPEPKQVNVWALRLAQAFKDPSAHVEAAGTNFFTHVKSVDEAVEGFRSIIIDADVDKEFASVIRQGLSGAFEELSSVGLVQEQLSALLEAMRPGEMLSVPLRKALRPARRGLTRVTDSLQLIASWRVDDL